jgi:outer membrane protein assembly factor BamB
MKAHMNMSRSTFELSWGRGALLLLAVASLSACSIIGGGNNKGPKTPVVGNRVSILSSDRDAAVDAAVADVPVTLPDPYVNDEWAQSGGNSFKMIGHVSLGASPHELWQTKIAGSTLRARLAAPPVVLSGKLFVIDADAHVIAMDAVKGTRLWETAMPAEGNGRSLFGGGVSAEGDRVFVTTGVGDVAALGASDGKIIWKKRLGGPLRGSPTLANGHVYVMSQDNQLFALNQSDGETQWTESGTVEVTGVFGVAAPAAGQGTVIAGYSSGELTAYRYENGRDLWGDALSRTSISTSVAALADVDADPVIDRGRVFAIGQGGRMASYELVSGQRLWELNIAGISTPTVAGEWVFVVTDDAKLLCVSRASGKIRWISELKRWQNAKKRSGAIRWSGPVLAGGRLLLVSTGGDLVYANPADGSVQVFHKWNHPMSLRPIVVNNILYVLSDDGRLTAFR